MNKFVAILLLLSISTSGILGVLNFLTDSWIKIIISNLDSAPKPVAYHTAVFNAVNNTMLIYGGVNSTNGALNTLSKYDLVSDSWFSFNSFNVSNNDITAIPSARYGHVAVTTLFNTMYIFGGRNETTVFNDIYKFNMENDMWVKIEPKGDVPKARWGHSGVTFTNNNQFLFFGGSTNIEGTVLVNDVLKYDFEHDSWISNTPTGASIPSSRYLHSAVFTLTNEMLVYGGIVQDKVVSDQIYIYSAENDRWLNMTVNATSPEPDARSSHQAIMTPLGTMIVFGGHDSKGNPTDTTWKYTISTNSWKFISPDNLGPVPRAGHTCISTQFNTMMVFGGYSGNYASNGQVSGGSFFNDIHKYNVVNSVLRSSSDGVVLVVILSLVGTMVIALCFALDLMNEKNEIQRLEMMEREALAKNNAIELEKIKSDKEKAAKPQLFEKF
ncbi:hypothetical protein CYY_007707 [Polysphondylium violaceum]|uniref:Attractin/MKLN-like beta-propeller domain-containing protein n=1 Tax=Polysphondylium violaceum TaxID=133409 RepID=A0A8J4PP97_9MYCE|nr:hypothetical protein CYY_007707 [Polysphondylium violaceum]